MFVPTGKILTPLTRKTDNPAPPPTPPDKNEFWKQIAVSLGLSVVSTALTQMTQIAISEIYGKYRGRGQRMEEELPQPPQQCNCSQYQEDDTEEMTREEIDSIISS